MSFLKLHRFCVVFLCGAMLATFISPSAAQAQTLERIQESGVIRLGFRTDAQPFSYREESGTAAGYSVELCRKVADAAKTELRLSNLKIEEVSVDSSNRFTALKDGHIDILCGAATVTLGRREDMSFSMPIFLSGMSAILRQDAPADLKAIVAGEEAKFRPQWRASYAEILKQRILGVIKGTTAESWLEQHINNFRMPAHVIPYPDYESATGNLLNGRVDVLFGDRAILLDIAARSDNSDRLVVLDRQFSYEAISFAVERGDDDFQLLIDRMLSRLYQSGEIIDIYTTYFGEPDTTAQSLFTRAALPE